MSLSITTWNVNGLRALLRKNALHAVLALEPDLLLLQEIKSYPEQIAPDSRTIWEAYQIYWHPAEKAGYSGVATFTLKETKSVIAGIGIPEFDREGRVIVTRTSDLTIINVYVPSGQRDHGRVSYKLKFYAAVLAYCEQLHQKGEKIILGGDINTAHREIDLHYPKQNQKTSGFLPEERAWIDRFIDHGFVDAYRVLYPERVQYTWWTNRVNARERKIGWRLDYFLISNSLVDRLQDVIIHEEISGSDHCPVSIILSLDPN